MHEAERSTAYGEEARWVRSAQGGDRAAFDRLVRRYRGLVLATASARLHNADEADDLAQEIWTRAWSRLPTLQDAALFPAWLKTLAFRAAINRQTRRPPVPAELDETQEASSDYDPIARCLAQEHQRALYAALATLPRPNRIALLLHVCEGYTCEELASLFAVPLTTVESRVHRAKGQLRRVLAEDEYQYHRRALTGRRTTP